MASTSASGRKIKAEVMDAFDELAPSASSSSASTPMKRPSYDVFINHRGPDVKPTVAKALYLMLTQWNLSVFLDKPELEYGDFFPQTLQAAMSSALVHIAIFSESYAESPWCLAELSFMVKSGAPIIPIFYHVQPDDLRWVHQGKGKYVSAFDGYVQKNRYLGKLDEWKKALYKASFYKGEVIENRDDEDRQLKDIVNTVLKKVKRESLWVADYPVGMQNIVEDFEKNTIHSMNDQGVQIIGIWGMGGSGKTTLARELYNKKSSKFKWSSFVYNVRDASTKSLLYETQQKFLKDLTVEDVGFLNIEEGRETLSRNLRLGKVFIVLDDVDHVDQLTALMPAKDRLESGSLIIVTTRVYDVLQFWGVTAIYKMRALDPMYAKQLFCWHAFEPPLQQDGFEELVDKFLVACKRLPLSLKVIARQLKGEFDKRNWESLLHKIMTVVPNDVEEILKISYDNLDHQEKEMFLDVACFFIGEESSLVIELWNGLGWNGQQGFKSLFNKCLVEIDKDKIKMHDHIRDLGRSIAKNQSPYRFGFPQTSINIQNQVEVVPSEGSPLWALAASICPCLMSALTTDFRNKIQNRIGIHGIIVTLDGVVGVPREEDEKKYDPRMLRTEMGEVDDFHIQCSDREFKVDTNCGIWSLSPFSVGLKYLVISGDTFNEVLGEVSRDLVWLRWFQIGQSNLPSGLLMKNLRVLEIFEDFREDHSLEKLWVDSEQAPVQLRHLLISDCEKFQGFPESIGRLNHLTKIVITKASNVTSLPDEFCHLKSLEHLVLLSGGLELLPINFGNLSSLRHLDLSQCGVLRRLPASFKNLMLLQHLDLSYCRELTSKSEEVLNCLQNITKLEYLNLCVCDQLEELPHHITNNVSLRQLYLGCPKLTSMPTSLGDLSSLTDLTIIFCDKLGCLPDSLGCLSSLVELNIQDCPKLEHLPDSLGCLSSLVELNIQFCPKLEHLPDSLGCLSSLVQLNIQFCPKLEHLPDSLGCLSCLTDLYIDSCPNLEHLPDSLGCLSSLTDLYIRSCPKLEHLPDSLRWLSSLTNLDIGGCPKLDHLPDSLGCLSSLVKLFIRDCQELEHLPDSLGCLKYLHIESCPNLEHLPDSLGCLTYLHIESCPNLKHLPDSLGCLTYLHIESCLNLKHLPD